MIDYTATDAYYTEPVTRRCDAFGHEIPTPAPMADDAPPCPTCHAIIRSELAVARDPDAPAYDRMYHVTDRCGRTGAIQRDRHDPPFTAWYADDAGAYRVIGRRSTRELAIAAVYASHDHTDG